MPIRNRANWSPTSNKNYFRRAYRTRKGRKMIELSMCICGDTHAQARAEIRRFISQWGIK